MICPIDALRLDIFHPMKLIVAIALYIPHQFRPITPDSALSIIYGTCTEAPALRPPQFSRWKVLGPLEFSAMS